MDFIAFHVLNLVTTKKTAQYLSCMLMKIATWNCNMAFRKKVKKILKYNPDILVIPECEHPDRFKFSHEYLNPRALLWFGKNQNKEFGVFSYSDFQFKLLAEYNPDFKFVIPIEVTGKIDFILYAIWANNPTDREGRYLTQVWKAIKYYDDQLRNKQAILVGDFNSNTIWDKPRREGNHSTVVDALKTKGIHSTYHHHFKEDQGKEQRPTLYMYRQKKKAYHIDYCFASEDLIARLALVEVGDFKRWSQYSDHVPVIVTFNLT